MGEQVGMVDLRSGQRSFVICARFDDLGADGSPRKLGIMGGTFDPIHLGHLAVAEQARDVLGLDAVVFMPTGRSPYKADSRQASGEERFAMCVMAVADNPAFDVSPLESLEDGITYTADTLRTIRAHYPSNVELVFIAGADAIASLANWHEADQLAKLARYVGINRPGTPVSSNEAVKKTLEDAGFAVEFIHAPSLDISSSDLRARIASGGSVRYLLPELVRSFIKENDLYRAW